MKAVVDPTQCWRVTCVDYVVDDDGMVSYMAALRTLRKSELKVSGRRRGVWKICVHGCGVYVHIYIYIYI